MVMGNTGLGTSLVLIAFGAVLAFAVDYELTGLDVQAIGWILIIVGLAAFLLSWLFLSSFSPLEHRTHTSATYAEREVVDRSTHAEPHSHVEPAQSRTEVNVHQPPEAHGGPPPASH